METKCICFSTNFGSEIAKKKFSKCLWTSIVPRLKLFLCSYFAMGKRRDISIEIKQTILKLENMTDEKGKLFTQMKIAETAGVFGSCRLPSFEERRHKPSQGQKRMQGKACRER